MRKIIYFLVAPMMLLVHDQNILCVGVEDLQTSLTTLNKQLVALGVGLNEVVLNEAKKPKTPVLGGDLLAAIQAADKSKLKKAQPKEVKKSDHSDLMAEIKASNKLKLKKTSPKAQPKEAKKSDLMAEIKASNKLKLKKTSPKEAKKPDEGEFKKTILKLKDIKTTPAPEPKIPKKKAPTLSDLLAQNFPDLNTTVLKIRTLYGGVATFNALKARIEKGRSLVGEESKEEEQLRKELIKGDWIQTLNDLLLLVVFNDSIALTPEENGRIKKYVARQIKELDDSLFHTNQFKTYILDKITGKKAEVVALQALIGQKFKELEPEKKEPVVGNS